MLGLCLQSERSAIYISGALIYIMIEFTNHAFVEQNILVNGLSECSANRLRHQQLQQFLTAHGAKPSCLASDYLLRQIFFGLLQVLNLFFY